jgi:glycosyltransferase involved in cell wall biosynthesis
MSNLVEETATSANIKGNPPLVSIVINNYNYANFVGQAIESALNQTYQHVEVIVVDDGSTDESRTVIRSFGSRIRSLFKRNGGQGSAYNAGFQMSRGELVNFLDADDFLAPRAIEETVRLWRPGVAKLQFYLEVIEGAEGKQTQALIPAGKLPDGNIQASLLRTGNYSSPPASGNFYARDALSQIMPMPEKDWITEADMYCIFQSAFFGEVRSIQQPLGFYRVHGKNSNAMANLTGKILRRKLNDETRRDSLLTNFCVERGIPYFPGTISKHLSYQKLRLASVLTEPEMHPFREDSPLSLLRNGVYVCWQSHHLSIAQKVSFIVWMAAVVFTPKPHRQWLLELAFAPARRPLILKRLLSGRKPKERAK